MPKWAVCIATIRPDLAQQWLDAWRELFERHEVNVYIMEDTDHKCLKSHKSVHVFNHTDAKELDNPWIIPRQTAACRSFVLYKAYQDGYDYYVSLDDDCYPSGDIFSVYETSFCPQLAPHYNYVDCAAAFGYKHHVRGYPYGIRKQREVATQYGVWLKYADYDALTAIENPVKEEDEIAENVIATPKYSGFTGCIMNVAITNKYLPVMYQLLMGKEVGYDRVEDIWSGLIMKKIADHFGDLVLLNGKARVIHKRASNPFVNLDKELPALAKNEILWEQLLKIKLDGDTPLRCYRQIAESGILPEQSRAMLAWANLFEEK